MGLITADANWYVLEPSEFYKLKAFEELKPEDKHNKEKVSKWVNDNTEELASAYGVNIDTLTSDSFIEKIYNGFFVRDCYGYYSDLYKAVFGYRPRGHNFDESSRQAFEEDYLEEIKQLEKELDEINKQHEEAVEENDKQIDDVINTAVEPEDIAKFKNSNYFELSEEALNKLRKAIDDKVHEKLMEHIDFYTLDELKRFKNGYNYHITKEDMKLIDDKIKEIEKEEEYENIPVKHVGNVITKRLVGFKKKTDTN